MVFGLFGGYSVEVQIDLDRPDATYAPGDVVSATINLAAAKGGKVREVRAGLVRQDRYQVIEQRRDSDGDWRDSYEWKTNETWVAREALMNEGSLPSDFKEAYRFDWEVPLGAPSCAGDIVQIKWLVKVTIDRPMAKDQNDEVELRIVAPPTGEYAQGGDFGEMNTNSGVVMRFSLPTLELVEGETLDGRLSVEPSQSIDAREVRVELMRDERVTPGDRVHVKQVSTEKVQVAGQVTLTPGSPQSYDFSIPVPTTDSPTHDTGNTSVTWLLVGTIDRPMRGDFTVTQWGGVYSG